MSKIIKKDCEVCVGKNNGIFCGLTGESLKKLNETKLDHHFKAGHYLFYTGNPPSGLYCISSGTVKLEMVSEQGKNHMVQIFGPGAVVGYRALFANAPYQSSAIVVENAEICFVPRTTVMEIVQNDPKLSFKFLMMLSKDFRMIENRLQRLSTFTATERIAEALLFLRESYEGKNWTRKEISEWAGTTPETVIRTLADFEAEGLIEQKGRTINIINRTLLLEKARIVF